jgi:hypothetical protein
VLYGRLAILRKIQGGMSVFNREFEADVIFLFAQLSVKNINFALISLRCLLDGRDIDTELYLDEITYYFFHIQSLLTACGNITNVFYNNGYNGRVLTERSKLLRCQFGICRDQFPLVFQKEARNTNEHFDERYDVSGSQFGDYNLLDANTTQEMRDSIMNTPHLRTFDRASGIYHTYDRNFQPIRYDLHELTDQLLEMRRRIAESTIYESGWIDNITKGEKSI